MPRRARSTILPGVPTKMWTGAESRRMSSLRDVPPVVTMHWTFMCLPISLTTADVCMANSRVGTTMTLWMQFLLASTFSSVGMTKAAVFPVPFFARAKMLRPARAACV